MFTTNGRVKKIKVQELDPAVNGLDGELASFLTSLIDQNAELAVKLEHMDSMMELAEKTVIEAAKEAERIRADAAKEANARASDIVAEAEGTAKAAALEVVTKSKGAAEVEAQRIIAEARHRSEANVAEVRKKAEEEALLIRREAEQLLASRMQTAQSAAKASEGLCARLDSDERIRTSLMEQENKAPEPPILDAVVSTASEAWADKPIERPSCIEEEGDEREDIASYDDFVDLAVPPPIALERMLELYRRLHRNPRVKVIDLKGSLDKGLWIRFIVHAHTPLLSVFATLPEVEKVSYEVIEVGKISSIGRKPR
jgi:F0F1-type ATP synthase membrane subunit b/b'